MPSCIAPCDINYCNAVASNPCLFLLLGDERYDGIYEVRALVHNAYACKQASQCIVFHHGNVRNVMHFMRVCMRGNDARLCVHAISASCTQAENVRNVIDFSLFSKNTLPPTKYRNPKTEHRIEIYLNISDYM